MLAYENTFADDGTTMLLSPDSDFFSFFAFFHVCMFRSKILFPDLRRCPWGGFRHGESEFEIQNDGREAPEERKEEKPDF